MKTKKVWRMKDKTYQGEACFKCGGTERYIKGRSCADCARKFAIQSYWKHPEEITKMKRKKYANNPEANKDLKLRRAYGISLEEYNILLEKQHKVCAICKQECVSGRMLCVDHNHKTNKVRGLLCVNCNRAIGNLKDKVVLFSRAINYLKGKNE